MSNKMELTMEPPPKIGKNIQKLRNARNLTLNVLSERSGVSKAMLSQIESDKVNPTIATVWKIAKGLGVDLPDLLDADGTIKRKFVVNRSEAIKILDTAEHGVTIKVFSPLEMAGDLEIYMLIFDPKSVLSSEPHFPGTEEFLTVIKGSITVQAGENISELHKGDFLAYHADITHTITNNAGTTNAVVHMVVRYAPPPL
jgi:transcriptional regulator with XRE-family HTH domain